MAGLHSKFTAFKGYQVNFQSLKGHQVCHVREKHAFLWKLQKKKKKTGNVSPVFFPHFLFTMYIVTRPISLIMRTSSAT